MIPRQIHFNTLNISKAEFEGDHEGNTISYKPHQVLWSSDAHKYHGSDWLRYVKKRRWYNAHQSVYNESMDSGIQARAFEIVPTKNARIYTIESGEDYEEFFEEYGYYRASWLARQHFDWWTISRDYDAIYAADYTWFDCWDCRSIAWLNWDAFEVKELNLTKAMLASLKIIYRRGDIHVV